MTKRKAIIVSILAFFMNPIVLTANIFTALKIAIIQTYKDNFETMSKLW